MTIVDLTFGQQWIQRNGTNYGVRTATHCGCGSSPHETLIIEGESHDDEPWVSSGNYRCSACGINGGWEPSPNSGQYVGETGIATPDLLNLDVQLSEEWHAIRMTRILDDYDQSRS